MFSAFIVIANAGFCLQNIYKMVVKAAGHYKKTQTASIIEWIYYDLDEDKRNTILNKIIIKNVLVDIGKDVGLQELWGRFRDKYYFVQDLEWDGVCTFVVNEIETLLVSEN